MAAIPAVHTTQGKKVLMNAKQCAVASALVIAGSVWAQTVPAEAWVGAPISTAGGTLSRSAVVADMGQFMSRRQAPQDAWVGAAADTGIVVGAAKRSEVAADFNLFSRAGLAGYQTSESFDPYSAQGRQRTATYQRLRGGPEFAREVARIEGVRSPTLARAQATGESSD